MNVSQSLFKTAMMDPNQPVPEGLSDAQDRPAGRRFNVYRNNVAVSLTEAMHTAFPVIAKLLGKQNMDGLSGIFLRAHPPSSPLMMFYGEAFPEFLAGMKQLDHLGFLPDVARLELAMRESYHAADATPINPQDLAGLAIEELLECTVELAPSLRVVRSPWPIYDIWRFNTEENAPKPEPVPQDVLITRPEFDPAPQPLPIGGADWIEALRLGASFSEAHDCALKATLDFDLGTPLALLLQSGAIIQLNTKG